MSKIPPFRKAAVAFLATRDVSQMESWTEDEWAGQFWWLDRSGLALPLAERLLENEQALRIPYAVIRALTKRLCDNQERMSAMLDSLSEIQCKLTAGHIRFCCLKGFSLIPVCHSVIRERHQVDLDFLIDSSDIGSAVTVLETLGYKLVHAGASGELCFAYPHTKHLTSNSWLYSVLEAPTVELHTQLWERESGQFVDFAAPGGWVDSIYTRTLRGVPIPRLAPAWQFFHLLLHVLKHLLYDSWVRLLSVYEIAVYLKREQEDSPVWQEVSKLATSNAQLASACALILYMVREEFPGTLPRPLNELCETHLSIDSALWVKHFNKQWLYAEPPGTKLALLVQRQFCATPGEWQSYMLRRLLPLKVPHGLNQAVDGAMKRTAQYTIDDVLYRLGRLSYHLESGCDYLWSAARWRQLSHTYKRSRPLHR